MNEFKPGDKVRCVNGRRSPLGKWLVETGKTYIIEIIALDRVWINGSSHYPGRFIKIRIERKLPDWF